MGLNFGGEELGANSADYIQIIMILSKPVAGDVKLSSIVLM